jgi:serine/threonine protein kinase
MLDDIKDHCDNIFKYIGAGTYCEAFKFYYAKNKCPHLATNNETECTVCKIYTQNGNYVIKEIQKTNRYSQNDFDNEILNQKHAMNYMPELVVNIFESWNEIHDADIHGNIISKLGTKQNMNKSSIIAAYGYITMEYMNYKDLYLNYKSGNPNVNWSRPINMIGLVFICIIILYNLHSKLNICHGDFRDTNIFLKYIGPDYKQHVKVDIDDKSTEYIVDTGGFHIKLGDFGLSETLYAGGKSFIFRDYEFLENIYQNRNCWKWMMTDKSEYIRLISFLQTNFINNINQRMNYYNYFPEHAKSRVDFWYAKHTVSTHSVYLYEFPKELLVCFIKTFYPEQTTN